MKYESVIEVSSHVAPGVTFTVSRMSYGRRVELMRQVRELAGKVEFLESGGTPADKMDAALLSSEINRLYVTWGLRGLRGLTLDGIEATPQLLVENGPEELFHEALEAVRAQTGLSEPERKN